MRAGSGFVGRTPRGVPSGPRAALDPHLPAPEQADEGVGRRPGGPPHKCAPGRALQAALSRKPNLPSVIRQSFSESATGEAAMPLPANWRAVPRAPAAVSHHRSSGSKTISVCREMTAPVRQDRSLTGGAIISGQNLRVSPAARAVPFDGPLPRSAEVNGRNRWQQR